MRGLGNVGGGGGGGGEGEGGKEFPSVKTNGQDLDEPPNSHRRGPLSRLISKADENKESTRRMERGGGRARWQ